MLVFFSVTSSLPDFWSDHGAEVETGDCGGVGSVCTFCTNDGVELFAEPFCLCSCERSISILSWISHTLKTRTSRW